MLPFLKLVTDPGIIESNDMVHVVYEISGAKDYHMFMIVAGVVVLLLITLSSVLTVFTFALQYKVVQQTAYDIERRILINYMQKDYIYFLSDNTSSMAKQLLTEVSHFSEYMLMQIVLTVVHMVMSMMIFMLVMIVDPMLAIVTMITLGGSYFLAYSRIRERLLKLGGIRIRALDDRFKSATEALGGMKAIKAQDCSGYFINQFSRASHQYHKNIVKYQSIRLAPSYFVQSVAFGGIVIIILYFLAADQPMDDIVPILGLYAAAGYKLLPSLKTLFNAVSLVRYNHPLVDRIYNDLGGVSDKVDELLVDEDEPMEFNDRIELSDVTFRYPDVSDAAVNGVNMNIRKGSRVALAGLTGSGKTTLADIVMSLISPSDGRITVDGVPVTRENATRWRKIVGYVPQDVFLLDDSITRNIAFGVPEKEVDVDRVRRAATTACLDEFITKELPDGYDTRVGERGNRLSGGQRQRLGLARALYRQPSLLILDEATSALDGVTQDHVMQAISELPQEITIIAIAHRLSTVRNFDTIYFMDRGKIVMEGRYEDLIDMNESFREMASLSAA